MQIAGLDEIDNRILEVIADHARLSYSDIGDAVGLSRVAVKKRMDQMEKSGVIRGYRTEIEPKQIPNSIQYFLDIEADPEEMGAIEDYLAKDPMIRQIYLISGSCRIHAIGLAPNQNTLQVQTRLLYRNLKGVRRMTYSVVLSTLKDLDGGIEYESVTDNGSDPGDGGSGSDREAKQQ